MGFSLGNGQALGIKVTVVSSVVAGTVAIIVLRRPLFKLMKYTRRKMATLEEHVRRRFGEGGRTAAFIKDFGRGQEYTTPAKFGLRVRQEFAGMAATIASGRSLSRVEKREMLKRIVFLELTQLSSEASVHDLDWRPHLEGIPVYDSAVDLATGGTVERSSFIERLWFFEEPVSRWSLKELGYLACHTLLRPESHPMQTGRFLNILTGDLRSSHQPTQCLALSAITKVMAQPNFDTLSSTIELDALLSTWYEASRSLFIQQNGNYRARRIAGHCLLEILHHRPDLCRTDPAIADLVDIDPDGGLGIAAAAVSILTYTAGQGCELPANLRLKLVNLQFELLRLRTTRDLSKYLYFGMHAPWLQVSTLRLLAMTGPDPSSTTTSSAIARVLEVVGVSDVQNASSLRTKAMVLLETVKLVLQWNDQPGHVSRALTHIGQSLTHSLRLSRTNVVASCVSILANLRLDVQVDAVESYARIKQHIIQLLVEKTRTRHRLGALPFLALHRYYAIAVVLHEQQLRANEGGDVTVTAESSVVEGEAATASRSRIVGSLQSTCERKILESLSLDNVCEVLESAHSTHAGLLKTVCIDYIIANYDDVISSGDGEVTTSLQRAYAALEPSLRQEVGRMMMQLSHVGTVE